VKSVDENDFREFVRTRCGELMRRAYVLTGGDQDAAQDLMQVALFKAAEHWPDLESPSAFVRTVMYRQQISWRRRGWSRHESSTNVVPERHHGDHEHAVELKLAVRAALFQLTPKQRAVLFLRHFEDLPDIEVAEVLGCSVGTVRSTNHRALQRLREVAPELADLYGEATNDKPAGSGLEVMA
jgi:RNA polymerase sigma-70 factor (sigma-E family)